MWHRGYLTAGERDGRSELTRIIHQKPFLQGSLVKSTFKCGKSNCWCRKAEKGHPACYLAVRVGKKRKMIYVAKVHEERVQEWVNTYKDINKYIKKVSKYCLDRFKKE